MSFGRLAPLPRRCGEGESLTSKWLDVVKADLGDAFTQDTVSIIGAESVAIARLLTLAQWQAEKLQNNSLPGTSHDLLLDWAERLGVPFRPSDSIASIRSACEAKYLASAGASQTNIKDSLTKLLAQSLIDVTYFYWRSLVAPADSEDQTYWPKNPRNYLAGDFGLGDGVWTSTRAHIVIAVQQASGQSFNDLMYLVNVQMYNLLDTMLPAWSSFDFTLNEYLGFWLNDDLHNSTLGFTAL